MPTLENVNIRRSGGDAVCYAAHAIQDLDAGSLRLTDGVTVYVPLKTAESYVVTTDEGDLDLEYTGTGPQGHPAFTVR